MFLVLAAAVVAVSGLFGTIRVAATPLYTIDGSRTQSGRARGTTGLAERTALDESTSLLPRQREIEAALANDGFTVVRWVTNGSSTTTAVEGDSVGCLAHHHNATNYRTGAPKSMFVVEGSAYQLGWLSGRLGVKDAEVLATTYLDRLVPQLLDYGWAHQVQNTTDGAALFKLIGQFLIDEANRSWREQYTKGVWPEALVEEMRGFVDGCILEDPSTVVSMERIVTVNYAFDWISANVFSGVIETKLRAYARTHRAPADLSDTVWDFLNRDKIIQVPLFCDAFGAYGTATQGDGDVFLGRAFQLATGDVFQDLASVMVAIPRDDRLTSARVFAPGIIGAITAIGPHVGLGVDTIRSSFSDPEAPGFNSALLVRWVAETARSTADAVTIMANARRGCPWLYPLCDNQGKCVMIEGGPYTTNTTLDPLPYVTDEKLKALLPTRDFLQAHSSDAIFRNGLYIRDSSFSAAEYYRFNPSLFAHANVSYNASNVDSADTFVFATFTEEDALEKQLENAWFVPVRTSMADDFVVLSNIALVPEARIAMMSPASNFFGRTTESASWRYDHINRDLRKGPVDFARALDIITFLTPEHFPTYWAHRFDPTDPMSAQVEGAVSLLWMNGKTGRQEMHTKTGYWHDSFTRVQLPGYYPDAS